MHDLGSASLAPLPEPLAGEGDPRAELQAGADLVCFSGDKLLGGPQAGILLGRRDLVDRLARHPLARAVRIGKLDLAALEHTLLAYRSGHPERVPTWRMLHTTVYELTVRARALVDALAPLAADVAVADCVDAVGGGSHPEEPLPGRAVAIEPHGCSASELARRLRTGPVPVIATVSSERVLLHLRTVPPARDGDLAAAARRALAAAPQDG